MKQTILQICWNYLNSFNRSDLYETLP